MQLRIENLIKTFPAPDPHAEPVHVLKGCTLTVHDQEKVVVVGPSGVGKSTLLHILGLLDQPTDGAVFWGGKHISYTHLHRLAHLRNTHIGFIFQHHYLLAECTVLENIMVPGMIAGTGYKSLLKRATELMEMTHVADRTRFYPRQLSGGERQRVALCRALINKPSLILADEVTGSLDPSLKDDMMRLLMRCALEYKSTCVAVTHDFSLLEYYDTVYKLEGGQLFPG